MPTLLKLTDLQAAITAEHFNQNTINGFTFLLCRLAVIFVFGPILISCNEEKEVPVKAIQTVEVISPEAIIETVQEPIKEISEVTHWPLCGCIEEEYVQKPTPKDSLFAVEKDGILLDEIVIQSKVLINSCTYEIRCGFYRRTFVEIDTTPIPIPIEKLIIEELTLAVYPNPAINDVTIAYTISEPGNAILSIFSLTGQHIVDLINTDDTAVGDYTAGFNVNEIASGMYLVVLTNNDSRQVFRMAVTK